MNDLNKQTSRRDEYLRFAVATKHKNITERRERLIGEYRELSEKQWKNRRA